MAQLHRRFTDSQVKELIQRYLRKEIQRDYIQQILGIRKTRFFALIKSYRKDPNKFSLKYTRYARAKGSNLLFISLINSPYNYLQCPVHFEFSFRVQYLMS